MTLRALMGLLPESFSMSCLGSHRSGRRAA